MPNSKFTPQTLRICQSGELLPNLITLIKHDSLGTRSGQTNLIILMTQLSFAQIPNDD